MADRHADAAAFGEQANSGGRDGPMSSTDYVSHTPSGLLSSHTAAAAVNVHTSARGEEGRHQPATAASKHGGREFTRSPAERTHRTEHIQAQEGWNSGSSSAWTDSSSGVEGDATYGGDGAAHNTHTPPAPPHGWSSSRDDDAEGTGGPYGILSGGSAGSGGGGVGRSGSGGGDGDGRNVHSTASTFPTATGAVLHSRRIRHPVQPSGSLGDAALVDSTAVGTGAGTARRRISGGRSSMEPLLDDATNGGQRRRRRRPAHVPLPLGNGWLGRLVDKVNVRYAFFCLLCVVLMGFILQVRLEYNHHWDLQGNAARLHFPVDVVYSYVNGSDPVHRRNRKYWGEHWRALPCNGKEMDPSMRFEYVDNEQRFRDKEELLHSLRSLEMYAPWVRNVYLVIGDSESQLPNWLDTDNPRVRIVRESTLFRNQSLLPVFNSNAVETWLHYIPGLSEHFLYFNDDFFLASPTTPHDWFPEGGKVAALVKGWHAAPPGSVFGKAYCTGDSIYLSMLAHSNHLIDSVFGRQRIETIFGKHSTWIGRPRPQHAPVPFKRSWLLELEKLFPEAYDQCRRNRFRAWNDVQITHLYYNYQLLAGRAVARGTLFDGTLINSVYRISNGSSLRDRLWARFLRWWMTYGFPRYIGIQDHIDYTKPGVEEAIDDLQDLFRELYPHPSQFEKASKRPSTGKIRS